MQTRKEFGKGDSSYSYKIVRHKCYKIQKRKVYSKNVERQES